MTTPIRTAERDGAAIAYQVTGRGPLDLLVVHDFAGHLELDWAFPGAARLFERLGAFARVIRFDKRGTGLSSRDAVITGAEADAADALAVLDAAGSPQAAVFAWGDGAAAGLLLAARNPERVSALAVFGGSARPPHPLGEAMAAAERVTGAWGERLPPGFAPDADDALRRWWTVRARAAATPAAAGALVLTGAQADARGDAANVVAPTLVLHRARDTAIPPAAGKELAGLVLSASYAELPGAAHLPYVDPDAIADELETFFTGTRADDGRPGFAGYELERELGRGGMGTVHLARDTRLGRHVALKLLSPELADDVQFRERFLREQRIAASIEHPNVVPIYDAGETDGRLYLAMRYIAGTDLKQLIEAGALEPVRAVRIVEQVAAALDVAHARGLVHRDVKPANVLVDSSSHAYLCDFGLTKETASGSGVTATGQLVGTLDYLAPEQIRGGEPDGRADVYALGCVLYACLTGRPPFGGRNEAQTLWGHMQEDPAPPSSLAAGVPPELDAVVLRSLAKEPPERYGSAGELAAAARAALGIDAPAVVRRRRRGKGLLAVGGLLLAIAAGAVAYQLSRDGAVAPVAVVSSSLAALDPASGRIEADVRVGALPVRVVSGGGALWTLNADDGTISKVDPERRSVVRTFGTARTPLDLAYGLAALWIAERGQVERLDASGPRAEIELPAWGDFPDVAVAVGRGAAWAAVQVTNLARIDPDRNEVDRSASSRPTTGAVGGPSVEVAGDWVWIGDGDTRIWRRSPATLALAGSVTVGQYPGHLAAGGGFLWVTMPLQDRVWQIDLASGGLVRSVDVCKLPLGVTYALGAVWVACAGDGAVARIDPASHRVQRFAVGGSPRDVASDGQLIWVAVT